MSVLSRVQSNPEISTDDSAFVTELVTRAQDFVKDYCVLPRFPSLAQGYVQSGASPSTDLTALASNTIYLWLNDSPRVTLSVTLANCDSGANIATELQAQIRAVDNDYHGFDEVTVSYASSLYTVTSGRYGEMSRVIFEFDETTKHVAQALKLATCYGAREYVGMLADDEIESATVELVEQLYRRVGVEGLSQYTMHQGEFSGAVHRCADPMTLARLRNKRRLW